LKKMIFLPMSDFLLTFSPKSVTVPWEL